MLDKKSNRFFCAEFDPDTDIFGSGPALEASDDELLATTTVKSRYACIFIKLSDGGSFFLLCAAHCLSSVLGGTYITYYIRHRRKSLQREFLIIGTTLSKRNPLENRRLNFIFSFTTNCRGKERSRLRGDILLPGKDYSGKKSSRAALYGEDDDDDDEEGDDDDEEEEEDDSLEGDEDDSEEESDEEELENGVSKKEPVYKKQSKKVANDEEESESEEEEDEAAALEREYREMQRQEADARAGLEERAAKERRKGQAVHAQSSLWNSGLELRILLQRALQAGNRLPQPDAHRVTVEVDAELAAGLRGLARDATGVVRELTALLTSMEEQHPAIEEAAQAAGVVKKRKTREGDEDDENDEGEGEEEKTESDRLWDELDAAYRHFAPFRDASIDRWHRKTVLSSGSAARGGLKVLNQSVSSQVELLMRDAHRVVERTRLPKRQCLALCSVEEDKVSVYVCERNGGCRVFHLLRRNLENYYEERRKTE